MAAPSGGISAVWIDSAVRPRPRGVDHRLDSAPEHRGDRRFAGPYRLQHPQHRLGVDLIDPQIADQGAIGRERSLPLGAIRGGLPRGLMRGDVVGGLPDVGTEVRASLLARFSRNGSACSFSTRPRNAVCLMRASARLSTG